MEFASRCSDCLAWRRFHRCLHRRLRRARCCFEGDGDGFDGVVASFSPWESQSHLDLFGWRPWRGPLVLLLRSHVGFD